MSGPLPPVLYKYLRVNYANDMITKGALMFSTLSWFQNVEDPDRGDGLEGTHKYFPTAGLQVTKTVSAGRPLLVPEKLTLPTDSLQAKAAGSDHIFIYSTSTQPGLTLFDDPAGANGCVEIYEPVKFLARLRTALRRLPVAKLATLIHDVVRYYSPSDPPGNVHALPDRLTMHKHEGFSDQYEYRFAFGTKADVFDFEHVEYRLVGESHKQPRLVPNERSHRMLVRVGSLMDCCRLCRPTP